MENKELGEGVGDEPPKAGRRRVWTYSLTSVRTSIFPTIDVAIHVGGV